MSTPTYVLYNNRKWNSLTNNLKIYYYLTTDTYAVPQKLSDVKAMGMIDCGTTSVHNLTPKKYLILARYPSATGVGDVAIFDFDMIVKNYAGSTSSTIPYNLVIRWGESYSNGSYTLYYNPGPNDTPTTIKNGDAYDGVNANDLIIVTPTFNLVASKTATLGYTLGSIGSPIQMARSVDGKFTQISPPKGLVVYPSQTSIFIILSILFVIILFIIVIGIIGYMFYKKIHN